MDKGGTLTRSNRSTDIEVLQRYRCDRRELLACVLSSSLLKRVVLPPGAVSLDDIDLDEISVDYILQCARRNDVLELAEAIKQYHNDRNLPPMAGSGLGEVYFLVTHPSYSGPPPGRSPPSISKSASAVASNLSKTFSLRQVPSQQSPTDGESTDFEDAEEDDELSAEVTRRQLFNASDLVIALPGFATGLTDDDLRETAYEALLVSVGAAGGLISPAKEKKEEKSSKLAKRFARSKTDKHKPQPSRAPGLAGVMENMRTQLEISEADDIRTREALLNALSGRVGRRMDTLLVPLELLCTISRSQFTDRKFHLRWQKRQINLLHEGLLNHPFVGLDASDRTAGELKLLTAKLEESETLPSPAGPAQHAETLRAMRGVAIALAERAGRGDQTGEVCHWADGYHLNVRLYEKLLGSVFDILDEGQLVEEVEEILELLKSTWRVLGITQTVHDTCYTWVLFRQFVMTGEQKLLQHATQQMKRIASDAQRSAQERAYMKSLHSKADIGDGPPELSYVQSVLVPIKLWADKRLGDYHLNFAEDGNKMEAVVAVAMVSGRLIAEENELSGVTRMTSSAETAAVAKQAENYICSSIKLAYERIVEKLDSNEDDQVEHPLALLADGVQALAKNEALTFAPILSVWHPHAVAISASLLHSLYQKELKPFVDGVTHLTDDVASVLPAADSLEQYIIDLITTVTEEGESNIYEQQLSPYQVEVVSGTLIMRWVNTQLSRVSEWVERTIQQESWDPVSTQKRYAGSIVEVFRIVDETTDQFFNLRLPMRLPVLKALMNGFDNSLMQYSNRLVTELGDKGDLIPPAPNLTRYKQDMSVKSQSRKKVVDPRLPDEKRSSEINLLTTVKLCVRLNTLHYILNQLDALEDHIRERWAIKRPRDDLTRANGTNSRRKMSDGDLKLKRPSARPVDELSVTFEGSRKTVNIGIDKVCEFTGTKIIFWDMREPLIDGLYKVSVAQSRMEKVMNNLDPVLGQLCEIIAEPLRDRVVLGLLQAALDGLFRVLLDGGPTRAFAQSDGDMLEEDLNLLKEFFIADGDGLPRGVVENAASAVQQILNLYTLETGIVIESFKRASEQMAAGGCNSMQRGPRVATDADTLLRVLCHRLDRDASKFLKKQYKLPKV